MKSIPFKKFIPGIAWFFLVLVLIILPGEDIPEPSGWLGFLKKIYFDKWVHAGIFGILAFLFMWPVNAATLSSKTKWQYFIYIALAISVWGLSTEVIQLFIPNRSFDLLDWAADSLGAIIALFFSKKVFLKELQ